MDGLRVEWLWADPLERDTILDSGDPPREPGRRSEAMSSTVAILLAIALLAGNAFFVGAEFAVISARRSVIEPMAEQGSGSACRTLGAMENVSMIACAQWWASPCVLWASALWVNWLSLTSSSHLWPRLDSLRAG